MRNKNTIISVMFLHVYTGLFDYRYFANITFAMGVNVAEKARRVSANYMGVDFRRVRTASFYTGSHFLCRRRFYPGNIRI